MNKRECLYFIKDGCCNLPSITGGSDYSNYECLRTDTCKMLTSGELEN